MMAVHNGESMFDSYSDICMIMFFCHQGDRGMKRLPTFLFIIFCAALLKYLIPAGSGFSVKCVNDQCQTVAASSLQSIAFGLVFLLLILFFPRKEMIMDSEKKMGFLRRLGAIYVDLFVLSIAISGVLTLPLLIIEYHHTGEFKWSFYREYTRATDWYIGTVMVFFTFGVWGYYHYRSLMLDRPTIGQYVLGYKIYGNGQAWTRSRILKRFGWTLLTMSIWPGAIFFAWSKRNRALWFDEKTDSLPVCLKYSDS